MNPSLSINLDGGGNVLLKCHAGCDNVRIVEALNLKMSDLFARPGHEAGEAPSTATHQGTAQPCTLQAYADLKQLPVSLLEELGLADVHYAGRPAVRISYLADDGTETAVRFRIGLKKTEGRVNDRFRWRRGDTAMLYGLWRLRDAREAGHVFLVEGESDCHALWFHGLPALGVPGASNWRGEWSELLEGVLRATASKPSTCSPSTPGSG